MLPDLSVLLPDLQFGDRCFSACWGDQSCKHADRGCLTGAVRPEKPEYLTLLHLKVEVLHRNDIPESSGQSVRIDHGNLLHMGIF